MRSHCVGGREYALHTLLLFLYLIIAQLSFCEANRPPTLIRNIDLSVVNENTPLDTQVFQLVALDPEGSPVAYHLNGTRVFRVDKRTGIVYVAAPIDREQLGESIHFTVIIEDQVGNGLANNIVKIPVTVLVIDENDNPPEFRNKEPLNLTIPEDTNPGQVISPELVAQDPDLVGSILRAYCDGCETQFHVQNVNEPTSSQIRFQMVLTRPLVYRPRQSPIKLSLRVSDGVHNRSLPVQIRILDVQNRPPMFIGASQLSLPEDTPILSVVYHVRAIDGDALTEDQLVALDERSVNLQLQSSGRRLAYFLDENPADLFTLDQNGGELRLANQLDREADYVQHEGSIDFVLLRVRAVEMDDETGQLDQRPVSTALNELRVIILDVNDQRPTFDQAEYKLSVAEDLLAGSHLNKLKMNVRDLDLGINAQFALRLHDPSGLFELRPNEAQSEASPQLWLKSNSTLDYENPNHRKLILTLEAVETQTRQKWSTKATLELVVTDVNDNPPQFEEPHYFVNLMENAMPGSIVVSIQARDLDSPAITRLAYSLSGPEAHLFELHPSSGVIKVASCDTPGKGDCLDYEQRKQVDLNLTAVDGQGFSASVPVTIRLLDANDNPPQFQQTEYEVQIDENANEFDQPLIVNATDADVSSLLIYSIEPDGPGQSNEHHPAESFTTFDDEPIESDLLTQPLDLSNSAAVLQQFSIDSRTGQIRLNRPIAYSEQPIRLRIRVHDGLYSALARVRIHVRDTNDNSPRFLPPIRSLNVSELAQIGEFITQLAASDLDVGENARISYSLHAVQTNEWNDISDLPNDCRPLPAFGSFSVNNNEFDSGMVSTEFRLDSRTGVLIVAAPLDFDRKAHYMLLVRAQDHGQPRRCGYALLHVHVINENNKPPRLQPTVQTATVQERALLGSHIYTIEATDPDYPEAMLKGGTLPQLVFRLESVQALDRRGRPLKEESSLLEQVSRFFGVDPGGRVIVAQPLKHELAAQVTLNVSVLDSGAPVSQVGYGQVNLIIEDYNDNPPVFDPPWTVDHPTYRFEVPEEQPVGSPLARLHAIDPDTNVSRYAIEPNSSYFAVDAQTGQISIIGRLDYETVEQADLHFRVVAYDSGQPQLTAAALVQVQLQNLNDNAPIFDKNEYQVSIPENSDWNSVVVRVNARDADKGLYGQVRYAITAQQSETEDVATTDLTLNETADAMQFFYIEEDTGVIRVVQGANLDREAGHRQFQLQVAASDSVSSNGFNFNPFNENNVTTGSLMTAASGAGISVLDDLFSEESREQQPHSVVFAIVRINIEDVNDNPPIFAKRNLTATVYDYGELFDPYGDQLSLYLRGEVSSHRSSGSFGGDHLRTLVLQLNATDADEGLNGLIKYQIVNGASPNVFELDPISGKLWASRTPLKLNPARTNYRLEVEARDQNGIGQLTDRAYIQIKVKKVNKHAPKFRLPLHSPNAGTVGAMFRSPQTNHVYVLENQPIGILVTVAIAEDADEGSNGQIQYGFKLNTSCVNQTEHFEIEPNNGEIRARVTFDREQRSEYRLVLCARDFLAEPQTFETTQPIIVRIGDLDDNRPEFERPQSRTAQNGDLLINNELVFDTDDEAVFVFRVSENLPRGTVVGQLKAVDKDELPQHRQIRYELIDGNQDGRFHLNADTGLLQLNASLDREQRDLYELIVRASPVIVGENQQTLINQQPPKIQPPAFQVQNWTQLHQLLRRRSYDANDRSLALIRVHVLDLNDNPPTFEQQTMHVAAQQDTTVNVSLLHVQALDADLGANASLSYSLTAIDLLRRGLDEATGPVRPIPSPFHLHSNTGQLSVVQPLSTYPVGSRFTLHLQARERSAPYRSATAKVQVYLFELRQLIRLSIRKTPAMVNAARRQLEQRLSELLQPYWRPLITSIKYRVDTSKGRVLNDETDCLLLVVDKRQMTDVPISHVISRLDSQAANAQFEFNDQRYSIEKVTPVDASVDASISGGFGLAAAGSLPILTALTQQLGNDTQTLVLVVLLSLITIGLLCTFVSCCCLRSWYYQKLIERAERAQRASMMGIGPGASPPLAKLPMSFGSECGNGVGQNVDDIYGHSIHSMTAYGYGNGGGLALLSNAVHPLPPNGTVRSTRVKNVASRQQVPQIMNQAKENPLWSDNGCKFYEQQELSVQMQDNS